MRAIGVGLAALMVSTLSSSSASAFVRSRTSTGTPVFWASGCVFVTPDSGGTADLPGDMVTATIQKSLANWQTPTASCSYLKLTLETAVALEAHYDGINTVKFRSDRWCHPDDTMSHDQCYSPNAAAITTAYFIDKAGDKNDGELLDADIELNDINFTFEILNPSATAPRAGTSVADLENTLTHELGHLQGLDHTCADAATPANETDDTGNAPPPCDNLDSLSADARMKIETATMYNSAVPGDTSKRSIETDDKNGICAIYPTAKDPKTCAAVNLTTVTKTAGCSFVATDGRAPIGLAIFLSVVGGFLWLTRLRRARA